jgi:tight adherence protein C
MELIFAAALFVVVAALVSWIGLRFWVRPKVAIERVTGAGGGHLDQAQAHPSLALHDFLQKIGKRLPTSARDSSEMQKQLIRAGIRAENAVRLFYGAKVAFAVICPLVMMAAVSQSESKATRKTLTVVAAAGFGFMGPTYYVRFAAKRRQRQIQRGLPNALDLLVVCVESGLGLDQAILQVAKELQHAHPEISEEFAFVNLELKAGKRRTDALRNLAERTSVEELRRLVAVLIQADRFGTGVAQSLRGHADFMRVQARQAAEEKAAKLGVKLVFPIFFCILPSLFVVTVGPVGARIVRDLGPMMDSVTRK